MRPIARLWYTWVQTLYHLDINYKCLGDNEIDIWPKLVQLFLSSPLRYLPSLFDLLSLYLSFHHLISSAGGKSIWIYKFKRDVPMRFTQMPIAAARDGDTEAMVEAIQKLVQAGVDVLRPADSHYQLKVNAATSNYPARGTIFIDGQATALDQRGLRAIFNYLELPAILDSVSISDH